jgi:hypothetical protein
MQQGHRKLKKHEYPFDLVSELIRIAGVDLTKIPAIGASTALTKGMLFRRHKVRGLTPDLVHDHFLFKGAWGDSKDAGRFFQIIVLGGKGL